MKDTIEGFRDQLFDAELYEGRSARAEDVVVAERLLDELRPAPRFRNPSGVYIIPETGDLGMDWSFFMGFFDVLITNGKIRHNVINKKTGKQASIAEVREGAFTGRGIFDA